MIERKKIEEMLEQVRKPGRYIGNEWNSVKKDLNGVAIKFALVFPDLYEVGMSHLGFKLMYHLLNEREDTACERVFSPDKDLEDILRKERVPLFSLESREGLSNFDVIGFSLAYELNYTNMLNILDLAGIPLLTRDRSDSHPLIIAGGPSVFNPEPISDFVDCFMIGEAEESVPEALEIIKGFRKRGERGRKDILRALSAVEGAYVPSLYQPAYNDDGTLVSLTPADGAPLTVKKRTIGDLESSFYPTEQIVPYISIVHDRISVEIMRGCPNLCRFCQARSLYHHKRERSPERIFEIARECAASTGYEELSLLSLSSGNHSRIAPILSGLTDILRGKGVKVSLPSLHVDEAIKGLPGTMRKIGKSGLTFAPEAASERLRAVINKNIDINGLREAVAAAAASGWRNVKLYFMIGLPTETMEDVEEIALFLDSLTKRTKRIQINVSVASFIPKPHTPFQWYPMEEPDRLSEKISYLRKAVRSGRVKLKFHDTRISVLEGLLSRGDRRLNGVILRAFKMGCRFDGWMERLDLKAWMDAVSHEGLSAGSFLHRRKDKDELLPWDHIDCGVSKDFFLKEAGKAAVV